MISTCKILFNLNLSGPAENIGCLTAIAAALPTFLIAYGSMAAVLALGQFIALMFGCSLCCSDDNHPEDMDGYEEPKEGGEAEQVAVAS